ncbi:hypothetical protein [Burkholderia ubonensis]|uniref:hypothetical protein n=1 Tax=Burkholderia ubonensis TaxID=101571 RepID=UPI000AE9D423|nr:hypothetical protein [Burkholderia ubonensis]
MTLKMKAARADETLNSHEAFVPTVHACEYSPEEGFRYFPSTGSGRDAAAGTQDS